MKKNKKDGQPYGGAKINRSVKYRSQSEFMEAGMNALLDDDDFGNTISQETRDILEKNLKKKKEEEERAREEERVRVEKLISSKEYQEEIARESKPLLKKMRELKAEGYSNDDISKIICGANKKDFTPENK